MKDSNNPDRLELFGELRSAIEAGQLLLHYQPKVSLRDGSLVGLEALVRWQHPRHGFLPPSDFISLAEDNGMIYPLSAWVLNAALQQHRAWLGLGLDVPVAVNLSRRALQYPALPQLVAQLLARWDVAPGSLVLEIAEPNLMTDFSDVRESVIQLRNVGVRLSIDDFGTGYSSVAALARLSVHELKIDASFVQAMASDASARAIVRGIIELGDALSLLVIAEGVEDQATWDVLAGFGCAVAQGYFISPPFAADELETWLAQTSLTWPASPVGAGVTAALAERTQRRGAQLRAEEAFIARKQVEAALPATEERTRLAMQAARMGTWDNVIQDDALIWSAETEALHGLAPGTFEGTNAAARRLIHPDDLATFLIEINARSVERPHTVAEYRAVWPDGSLHWLEAKSRGMYAADGALLRVSGTSMDITERKLAEEALRTSEERFRRQYKGIPLPTYSWLRVDDDFVLQDYNDAADSIGEGNASNWMGKSASARFADRPEMIADLHACIDEQRAFRRELLFHYPETGRTRDLALTYVFVPPLTVMLHSEDITERKQAERQREAMAQSEKLRALGQMATGIAHDINQSLMLLSAYSDLARQALGQEPLDLVELDNLLATTTQAALDGGETVKRLLRFTRTAPEQNSQPVNLASVVRDAALLTAPRWRDAPQAVGRPISLFIEADTNPTIQGSPARLLELLTNLIFNAVDALPDGGTIRLRVVVEDGQAVVEVTDSGLGMSAEVQERIFEPFFTTKGEGGTGLGLAMGFGIVEQHGGHIEVRSAPGDGATIRMTFPLAPVEASTTTAAEPAPTPTVQAGLLLPLRILAVDDEPMMTRAVVRMLRPSGHVVTVAASGEEALDMLAEQPFDVVVSDMGMGAGMNGWELADAVKLRFPGVRFMLATGWGAAIDPVEAQTRGVEAVLSKPYRPTDLLAALGRGALLADGDAPHRAPAVNSADLRLGHR